MNRFRTTKFPKSLALIKFAIERFKQQLAELDTDTCLTQEELCLSGLMKKKHYYYGAYLSALTSIPILSISAGDHQTLLSMAAKTAAITSIKVLDNINDKLSTKDEAILSQWKHLEAFAGRLTHLDPTEDYLKKAENSCMSMAQWTYNLVSRGLDNKSETLKIYMKDFKDYIEGQIRSMDEKAHGATSLPTIQDYIQKINEKSVGKIWVDIDFCFFEKGRGTLNNDELRSLQYIRRAAGYFFKGCNIYDDIADLEEDLKLGILSSVPLLALDMGKIDEQDLERDEVDLMNILRRCGAVDDAVHLGDLIFLQGIRPLQDARLLNDKIDIEAITFGAKVLRMFAIRKWLLKERSFNSLSNTAVSIADPKLYRIPETILQYAVYT
ncbi:MAG: hypothetical protein QXL25_03400 [Candidatus Bathyarchaeia archaeon]